MHIFKPRVQGTHSVWELSQRYCGALHWPTEKITGNEIKSPPFTACCKGSVVPNRK